MTFEQWWTEHTSDEDDPANLVRRFGVGGVIFLKPVLANVWNAALFCVEEMMLRCCCGHPRSQHANETGSCTHENCTCVNLCDCWVIMSESAESEHPGILKKHFEPLVAKQ